MRKYNSDKIEMWGRGRILGGGICPCGPTTRLKNFVCCSSSK